MFPAGKDSPASFPRKRESTAFLTSCQDLEHHYQSLGIFKKYPTPSVGWPEQSLDSRFRGNDVQKSSIHRMYLRFQKSTALPLGGRGHNTVELGFPFLKSLRFFHSGRLGSILLPDGQGGKGTIDSPLEGGQGGVGTSPESFSQHYWGGDRGGGKSAPVCPPLRMFSLHVVSARVAPATGLVAGVRRTRGTLESHPNEKPEFGRERPGECPHSSICTPISMTRSEGMPK